MKQKCPTCNAGPDKDIFGMCSECGAINRPYEDLPLSAQRTPKSRKSVSITLTFIAALFAFFIAEWLLNQPIDDGTKLSIILIMGFFVGLRTAYIQN